MSHILFTLSISEEFGKKGYHFWPGDGTEEVIGDAGKSDPSLYEYVGVGNSVPLLVGVDAGGHVISKCGTVLGAPEG